MTAVALLLLLIIQICKMEGKDMSDCLITPHKLYDCEDFEDTIDIQMSLISTDDDGGKAFNMDATINETLDEEYMVDLKIDRYIDGVWNENFYNGYESICSFIDEYLSKFWKNLREKIDPPVEEECELPAGHYKLTHFEASSKDVDFPASLTGTFRARICLSNPDGECRVCKMTEGELNC